MGLRHRLRGPAGRCRHHRRPRASTTPTLAAYCLMLGDDALVYSHRLSEWCSHAPDLEEDIALANIALDLLGQARLLLARAAAADPAVVPALPEGSPVPAEDALAFFRADRDVPQRAARRVRQRRLRRHDRAAAAVLDLAAGAAAAAGRRRVDHGARRDRRQGRQGGHLPPRLRGPLVPHPGAGHRGVPRAACSPPSTLVWPLRDELFVAHSSSRALAAAGVGVDPATVRGRGRRRARRRCSPPATSTARTCPAGAGQRRHGPRRPAHRGPVALLAEMQSVARAHPIGASGDRARELDRLDAGAQVAASVTDPEMPMLTLEDLGVLRVVALRTTARSSSRSRRPTPAARRWPRCATTWCTGSADDGFAPPYGSSLTPAWSSDWITDRGRHGAGRARHLGPGSRLPDARVRSRSRCCRPGAS